MKKSIFLTAFCLLTAMSCRTNDNAENVAKTTQGIQSLQEFNKAMLSVIKMPDQKDSPKSGPTELSDYKKNLILPAAITLITSTGVTKDEVLRKTNNDKELIFRWAVDVYNNRGSAVNFQITTKY